MILIRVNNKLTVLGKNTAMKLILLKYDEPKKETVCQNQSSGRWYDGKAVKPWQA